MLILNLRTLTGQTHLVIWVWLCVVAGLWLAGCASSGKAAAPKVPWEEAIDLIQSGGVGSVVQYHSREVALIMKDGGEIWTREPIIDLVFDIIEECGAPCAEISLITE